MTTPTQAALDAADHAARQCPHCGENPAGGHRLINGRDCPNIHTPYVGASLSAEVDAFAPYFRFDIDGRSRLATTASRRGTGSAQFSQCKIWAHTNSGAETPYLVTFHAASFIDGTLRREVAEYVLQTMREWIARDNVTPTEN